MEIKRMRLLLVGIVLVTTVLFAGCVGKEAPPAPQPEPKVTEQPPNAVLITFGGRHYDKWWKETGGAEPAGDAAEPTGDHPLWATQTTNTRSGSTTWRCKECHGWDYKGKDGAYGSGSHYTGFPGVYTTAQTKTKEELLDALKGKTNPNHDFSSVMSDEHLEHLADFLKYGLVDQKQIIDYEAGKPIAGDAVKGKEIYDVVCMMCHGADGKMINFGSPDDPEYVGTVAGHNPWEFVHKVRNGQPGSVPQMPSAIANQWTDEDVANVLAYAQSFEEDEHGH